VAFGFEPNFRAFTDGTQTLLRNAILGANPPAAAIARLRGHASARTRADARRVARRLRSHGNAVELVVVRRDAARTRALLRRAGRRARLVRGGGRVTFLLANRRDASGDENAWARGLEQRLRRAGIRVVMYRVP
jgi:hypothetical protein